MNATCTLPGERYYYCFEEFDDTSSIEYSVAESGSVPSLENYEKPPAGDPKFWRRQFGQIVTAKQRRFDWLMGVFMPMVCFYFDPFVFRDWDSGSSTHAMLGPYQTPAYVLAYAAIMAQAAWMLWGDRMGGFALVIAIVLSIAAIASLIIGLILFPFSLVGMVWLIGLLGFTPLMTAIVYARTAVRTLRIA
ncbi:MAG: hypothetical protein ACKVQW_17230 [Pyrinomonadaceae bacterium]